MDFTEIIDIKYIIPIISFFSAILGGFISNYLNTNIQKNKDIHTFRYSKLYELNTEIYSLNSVDYTLSNDRTITKKTASESAEKFGYITGITNRALPLIHTKYQHFIKELFLEEEALVKKCLKAAYSENADEPAPLKDLLQKRLDIENKVKSIISESLLLMIQ